MGELETKQQRLEEQLSKLPSLIVAYSGGVDSAYLAYAAHQVMGERMLAVTALSASYSARDRAEAEKCVAHFNFPHEFISTDELANPAYRANNADRCYYCKDELFDKLDRDGRPAWHSRPWLTASTRTTWATGVPASKPRASTKS